MGAVFVPCSDGAGLLASQPFSETMHSCHFLIVSISTNSVPFFVFYLFRVMHMAHRPLFDIIGYLPRAWWMKASSKSLYRLRQPVASCYLDSCINVVRVDRTPRKASCPVDACTSYTL